MAITNKRYKYYKMNYKVLNNNKKNITQIKLQKH